MPYSEWGENDKADRRQKSVDDRPTDGWAVWREEASKQSKQASKRDKQIPWKGGGSACLDGDAVVGAAVGAVGPGHPVRHLHRVHLGGTLPPVPPNPPPPPPPNKTGAGESIFEGVEKSRRFDSNVGFGGAREKKNNQE